MVSGYIQISILGKWHSRRDPTIRFEPDGRVGCFYVKVFCRCSGFLPQSKDMF